MKDTLMLVSLIWMMFCIITYFAHKLYPKDYPTWTSAMKGTIQGIATLIYEELSGKQPASQIENRALLLSDTELDELRRFFEDSPYITPVLYLCRIENSVCFYEFRAMGIIAKYKELDNKDIAKMCYYKIQTFFREKRGFSAHIYIDMQIATPDRLCFAIPLSEDGANYLEKQKKLPTAESKQSVPSQLEEEIDLSQDK